MADLCPFCEVGRLHVATHVEEIDHGGKKLSVPGFQISVCDHCQEEMVRGDQAKANQRLIADAILSSDGKLTTGDLKCIRLRHGLNQSDSALIFGGGANAFSKYERGEVQQSKSMDLLVRLYDEVPAARDYLRARAGLDEADNWTSVERAPTPRIVRFQQRASKVAVAEVSQPWQDAHTEPAYANR